ncbi:uncharacterized protein LOC127871733 isoform X2 [Dreissena polymorpha]|uniref:Uncharacterized protein n=2 Tax=Dreissena polymorpha TaxID=45954 RepID=A0A9D4MJT4_DREPO|nr:uncharacterized protein LOC127871733 isoform X2 [Dreissena polymorpha]KAH3877435.1 hypothetical protein DPMN_001302 [Dreissena polymorpha]
MFAVVGLGFSIAKVIFGAEFITKCPISDIVPVYIVVSGCLPVLLSSLKEPYDNAGDSRKCDSRIKMSIAGFAIAANLAWLISGTVWTTSLLTVSDYGRNTCSRIQGNNSEIYGKESDMGLSNDRSATAEIYTITTLLYRNTNVTNTGEIYNRKDSKQIHVDTFNAHDKVISHHNLKLKDSDTTKIPVQTNGNGFTIDYFHNTTKKAITSVQSSERAINDTSWVPGSSIGRESRCADCSVEVIFFALACVVCDWTMFGIGIVYLLYLSCHKVARLKYDWLIIRT